MCIYVLGTSWYKAVFKCMRVLRGEWYSSRDAGRAESEERWKMMMKNEKKRICWMQTCVLSTTIHKCRFSTTSRMFSIKSKCRTFDHSHRSLRSFAHFNCIIYSVLLFLARHQLLYIKERNLLNLLTLRSSVVSLLSSWVYHFVT